MKNFLLTLSILFTGVAVAQETEECGTKIADITEYLEFENGLLQEDLNFSTPECKTIRIVVHVIYNGKISDDALNGKISEDQIRSQIRITNQFFRNDSLMYDPENIPLGYEVALATTDPDGNPTNGIIYHDGYALWGESWDSYGLKYSMAGATSEGTVANELAWGADINGVKYLNTYVVSKIDGSSGGGVQAYAYFPSLSKVYGNYILYNSFGSKLLQDDYGKIFNLKSYTNKGTSWTHELLHNFGIFHVFQGNSCAPESNPLLQGDRVADTPPQTQGQSCVGACGFVSYNVMDYLNQTCRNRITSGQVDRANTVILQNLLAYMDCSSATPPPNETETDPCASKTADFNGDGVVNIIDFSQFSQAFLTSEGQPKFKTKFDLNCDGVINIIDFSIFSQDFGKIINNSLFGKDTYTGGALLPNLSPFTL